MSWPWNLRGHGAFYLSVVEDLRSRLYTVLILPLCGLLFFIRRTHPMGGKHMCPQDIIPSPVVKGHDKRQALAWLRIPLRKACVAWDVMS